MGIGIVGMFIPLVMTVYIINKSGAKNFALLSYMVPVATYLLAWAAGIETFFWSDCLAFAAILGSIVYFETKS